ncbi:nonsense-mediated mRNA decay factor SMG8-like [Oscarella lobularis]|uniref:nonsense-mediated mRNA decay factor SMG8-like n=1 Tax=Oscarella lobularis TaxID=121494 RepID=UPI00331414CE
MASRLKYFQFPIHLAKALPECEENAVCVVGIFGKSTETNRMVLEKILDRSLAKVVDFDAERSQEEPSIECFCDVRRGSVYLLVSGETLSFKSWNDFLIREKKYMQCLEFLFRMCHVILLVLPQQSLDLSYVSLFSILAKKLAAEGSSKSMGLDLSAWDLWRLGKGRCCVPRLLLVFQQTMLISHNEEHKSHGSRKESTNRTLLSYLDEQAYLTFSKCELSTGSRPLFKMTKRDSCYILPYGAMQSVHDPVGFVINCLHDKETGVEQQLSTLKEFLEKHVDTMCFATQLPDYRSWLCVGVHVFDAFDREAAEAKPTRLSPLESLSENVCQRAYSSALKAYRENPSLRQTESEKQLKLSQCVSTYRSHSSGPAAPKYKQKLVEECERTGSDEIT